ncbi:MAG: hypothetical protein KGS61_18990 [Verrucomicrobia bacterium]|nr:hypothetical protein [Verrucomicrobiota bacterium]
MLRTPWLHLLLLGWLSGAVAARGQIDPETRRLIEVGYNQPMEGIAPLAAYAFYYQNQPGFLQTNLTLRLAVAPIYLDSELGIAQALGPNTDLGIGVSGGGFADSYWEIRQGAFRRDESFVGHGGELAVAIYHRFNPDSLIPLYGVVRNALHYSLYERDDHTAANFALPDDQYTYHLRTGLRWGGMEPMLQPSLAMEMSAWYEGQFRTDAGPFGFDGDRVVEPTSHMFWGRALLAYTFTNTLQSFQVSVIAGTSIDADRLSAYRLGGMLPLAAEFPLGLPGYFTQEFSARQFALWSGQYSVALDYANHWNATVFASTAWIDYLPGFEQPGRWNSGVGGGITWRSTSQTWQVMLAYARGLDAIRSSGRGANTVSLLCQIDLEARHRYQTSSFEPRVSPDKLRGLDWLLGR